VPGASRPETPTDGEAFCGRDADVEATPVTSPAFSASELVEMVTGHIPDDSREAASKERFLAELARLPQPCDETADPVHVTASAVIVGRRGTIMLRHRRLGRWMQPGGHLNPGEAPSDGARREAMEETGLPVGHPPPGPLLLGLDVHDAALGHTHLDLRYLLIGADTDPAPAPGESPAVRWCSFDEAAELADEALAGSLALARRLWSAHGASWLLEAVPGETR
jgi:8-oxo-dGTP pyrophosphatase MutT (NUDIX family)